MTRLSVVLIGSLLVCPALFASEAEWVSLFDGKSLDGWKVAENPDSIRAADGVIVCDGPRAHAYYEGPVQQHDFRNFELEFESKLAPAASSGMYFHTAWQEKGFPSKGHEVQINNTHRTPKRTGSLYEIVNLHDTTLKDNEWMKFRLVVQGKRIQIFVNGQQTVDFTETADYVPPADRPERRISSGTFALQCTDPESKAWFRNIRVRQLP